METIKLDILNKRGFAACQAATDPKHIKPAMRGVLIQPNGTVVGCTNHYMVVCPDCVAPFEGSSFIVRATQLTKSQYTYRDTGDRQTFIKVDDNDSFISAWGGSTPKRQLIVADIIDSVFPDWKSIQDKASSNCDLPCITFNASYPAAIAKIVSHDGVSVALHFTGVNSIISVDFPRDSLNMISSVKMYLMPMTDF